MMKSGKRNVCQRLAASETQHSDNEEHRKQNHCDIEKRRRDKMNHYITKLASMITSCSSMPCRLDKLTVLRMALQHIKSIRTSLCGFSSFHLRPSFLSSGNLLKNLILQMAAQEVEDNLFLVVSCDRGKVLFVSESSKDVLFYDQKELIGQSLFDILHKEDVAKVKEQINLSVPPKEMLVDSRTLQPVRGVRQAMLKSSSNHQYANGSTPRPGSRRSFFCRIKTGHLPSNNNNDNNNNNNSNNSSKNSNNNNSHQASTNSRSSDRATNQTESTGGENLLIHHRDEEAPTNHKQHCRSDRLQSTHSQRVNRSIAASNTNKDNSNMKSKNSQESRRIQRQQQQQEQHRQNLDSIEDIVQNNQPLAPTTNHSSTSNNNKSNRFSSRRGHAKYIVMRCTGYLKTVTITNDDNLNEFDNYTSGNESSNDDEGRRRKTRSINCLVAVCRRVPVDKDFKPDRPMTFTCRYSVDGKFVFADQRTTVALGYLPQELLGTSHYEYCNPEHYKIVSDCHKQSLQRAESVSSDVYQFRRKNGSYLWLQTRLRSFRNPWTKYIEFLIANHTTAEEVEPAHYSQGCVPTKFNQDITAAQTSQLSSPSSSFSLSIPSMESKKSSSPSSSSIGSTYSVDSWTQDGVFKMLNNSSLKVERARVGQSIARRVLDSYTKQTDAIGVTRSASLGAGSGSSAGNGTEDSSYSDPPSCSSQSSQNSIASSELQMLSNYVESVNNKSRDTQTNSSNLNTQNPNSSARTQANGAYIEMCDNESGSSSTYNASSSSRSGGSYSITSGAKSSESSGIGSSGSPNSSGGETSRSNKGKTLTGRHHLHHHHHHYHHKAVTRSRSSASSDAGIESSYWCSTDSNLFTTVSASDNNQNDLKNSREPNDCVSNKVSECEGQTNSDLKQSSPAVRILVASSLAASKHVDNQPDSIIYDNATRDDRRQQTSDHQLENVTGDVSTSQKSIINKSAIIGAVQTNTNIANMIEDRSDNHIMDRGSLDKHQQEKIDLRKFPSVTTNLSFHTEGDSMMQSNETFALERIGSIQDTINQKKDVQHLAIPIEMNVINASLPTDRDGLQMPEYSTNSSLYGNDSLNVSMPHILQDEQLVRQNNFLEREMTFTPTACYGCFNSIPEQSADVYTASILDKSNCDPTIVQDIDPRQVAMLPSLGVETSNEYPLQDGGNTIQPISHNADTNLLMAPIDASLDLHSIGTSSLYEEIDDDVLLEYIANLDSDTEFPNLPIWHLSCGRY